MRLVTEKPAADYVGVPLNTFRHWVATGRLPRALPDCALYDLKAIDAAIDRMSGLSSAPAASALDAWLANEARGATAT